MVDRKKSFKSFRALEAKFIIMIKLIQQLV